jgi:hypothetical protein
MITNIEANSSLKYKIITLIVSIICSFSPTKRDLKADTVAHTSWRLKISMALDGVRNGKTYGRTIEYSVSKQMVFLPQNNDYLIYQKKTLLQ